MLFVVELEDEEIECDDGEIDVGVDVGGCCWREVVVVGRGGFGVVVVFVGFLGGWY